MSLRLYNSLTRKKELFTPRTPAEVSMYVCGITSYDDCHIGHARAYLTFDIIRRYFEYRGYTVRYVQNFTDIDDKIIAKSKQTGQPVETITSTYIQRYFEDMDALGIRRATLYPKATENITEMIAMIQTLLEKEYAYTVGPTIYFDVRKAIAYGKLSGQETDQLESGYRIDPDPGKRSALDFALWKASKEGEPFWISPWGNGRPGWHIECSAMSLKFLGSGFDIHGGGRDLIFPHHENEIAQSECATGRPFVNYWVHNGHVTADKRKMSKSLKNFFTIRDLLIDYPPEAIRFFLLSTHYRTPINFSLELLRESKKSLEKIAAAIDRPAAAPIPLPAAMTGPNVITLKKEFEDAMNDDFNTAVAISVLLKLCRAANANPRPETVALLKQLSELLGIAPSRPRVVSVPEEIQRLIDQRNSAREKKDWAAADKLRELIIQKGFSLEDAPTGTHVQKL